MKNKYSRDTNISEDEQQYILNNKAKKTNRSDIICNDTKSQIYFSKMKELVKKLKLKDISMGMSNDYLEAINYQSTYLRIGSKIFGERN